MIHCFYCVFFTEFSMKINDKHLFLTSCDDVDTISKPLAEHFGLTSIVYQRNYSDGSEVRLSNQPEWVKHFYESELYKASVFEATPDYYQKGFVLWSALTNHSTILDEAKQHQIDHGVTLILPNRQGCEFFFLGAAPDKGDIVQRYLNNIDLLERFTAYFKDKAAPLLAQAEKSRIIIPGKHREPSAINEPILTPTQSELRLAFLQDTPVSHFSLGQESLSKRELDCIAYFLQGYSAKQIGEKLFLSSRTVESHLTRVRAKLDCKNKDELINALRNLQLHTFSQTS